jgi:hypothetical protein
MKGSQEMDPITIAIAAALSAGAITGLTETSKTAISNAYQALKALLTKKFGSTSEVVQAVNRLEAKPESKDRKEILQEEIITVKAAQDSELLAAAKDLLMMVHPQQAGLGKFTIQNNALVQGQNVGAYSTIAQQFGDRPKA